jgi:hypothetical protein
LTARFAGEEPGSRKPILQTFLVCCAVAVSGATTRPRIKSNRSLAECSRIAVLPQNRMVTW